MEDTDTVITGESKENTVTIDTSKGNVDVTFDDLKIDASDKGEAAVRVEGNGDVTIELDGDNELKSGGYNAGLEKDGHEPEGTLTIKDDKGKDGSLTAEGGDGGGAGIGGGMESTGSNIKITGGTIEAVGGEGAAGIGGGVYGPGRDIEISGGKVSATGGNMDEQLRSLPPRRGWHRRRRRHGRPRDRPGCAAQQPRQPQSHHHLRRRRGGGQGGRKHRRQNCGHRRRR